MDLIVRQAVEAGVGRIVAVVSDRSVAVPSDPGNRLARWQRVAREAVQQSGAALMPEIRGPLGLREAADAAGPGCTGLFFHQERLGGPSLHEALADGPRRVALLVGPEGGLAESETALLARCGFSPVFLGDAVLRTETAALYAIAAVKTVLSERDSWTLSQRK
jgi:16S rRNA (uracil1498-N3)-methyltransferase